MLNARPFRDSLVFASWLSLVVASFSGCTSSLPWTSAKTKSQNVIAGEKGAEELPPKEAAAACITTAESMTQQGHFREAAALYEKARTLAPSSIDFSRRLAALYDLEGEPSKAKVEFEKALKKSPNDADLANDYGCFQMKMGQTKEAIGSLERALVLNPKNERAKVNLARALASENRTHEAFELFAQVSGEAAAHHNMGVILAKQGRNEEATRAFHEATRLDPSLSQPKAFLAVLESNRNTIAR